MLTLADVAALHSAHADAAAAPVQPVRLGELVVGDGRQAVMGAINLSLDSPYRESVAASTESAVRKARVQAAQGAAVIDLGAESSTAAAEYVDAAQQLALLEPVLDEIAGETVVSVETYDPTVAKASLEAGARLINLTGREHEDAVLRLAADHGAGVVLCYSPLDNVREASEVPPPAELLGSTMISHFAPRVDAARALGVQVLVDPGVGFTYANLTDPVARARHQAAVLAASFRLRLLGVPICNALPHAVALFEEQFRTAEGFFAVLASLGGTHLFRTHEVPHVRAVLDAMEQLTLE